MWCQSYELAPHLMVGVSYVRRCGVVDSVSMVSTVSPICCTLSGDSCTYSFAVGVCTRVPQVRLMTFAEPMLCVLVAMARRRTWDVSLGLLRASVRGFRLGCRSWPGPCVGRLRSAT